MTIVPEPLRAWRGRRPGSSAPRRRSSSRTPGEPRRGGLPLPVRRSRSPRCSRGRRRGRQRPAQRPRTRRSRRQGSRYARRPDRRSTRTVARWQRPRSPVRSAPGRLPSQYHSNTRSRLRSCLPFGTSSPRGESCQRTIAPFEKRTWSHASGREVSTERRLRRHVIPTAIEGAAVRRHGEMPRPAPVMKD